MRSAEPDSTSHSITYRSYIDKLGLVSCAINREISGNWAVHSLSLMIMVQSPGSEVTNTRAQSSQQEFDTSRAFRPVDSLASFSRLGHSNAAHRSCVLPRVRTMRTFSEIFSLSPGKLLDQPSIVVALGPSLVL